MTKEINEAALVQWKAATGRRDIDKEAVCTPKSESFDCARCAPFTVQIGMRFAILLPCI